MRLRLLSLVICIKSTISTDGHHSTYHYKSFPLFMRLGLGALDGRSVWKPDPPLALPDMVLLQQAVSMTEWCVHALSSP